MDINVIKMKTKIINGQLSLERILENICKILEIETIPISDEYLQIKNPKNLVNGDLEIRLDSDKTLDLRAYFSDLTDKNQIYKIKSLIELYEIDLATGNLKPRELFKDPYKIRKNKNLKEDGR